MATKKRSRRDVDVIMPALTAPADSTGAAAVPRPVLPGDASIALSSRAIFWTPRHADLCRSLLHAPFMFWLVETLRPVRIVQIGLTDPGGYLTLCQAVDKLGLEAICMAVDPAGKGLGAAAAAQHDALYVDFSFVTDEGMSAAARHLHGGTVDLLIIDAAMTEDQIAAVRSQWLPLLSRRGVVAIHQAARGQQDGLLQTLLADGHPAISFPQDDPGLDVVLCGPDQPDRLLRLATLELGMPGYLAARQVFGRLGRGLESERQIRAGSAAGARVAKLEAEVGRLQAEVAAARAAENEQNARAAGLTARTFDLERAIEAGAKAAGRTSKDAFDKAVAEAVKTATEKATAQAAEKAEAETAALRCEIEAATGRIAGLEAALAEARSNEATQKTRADERKGRIARLESDLAAAQNAAEAAAKAGKAALDKAVAEAVKTATEKASEKATAQAAEKAKAETAALRREIEAATGRIAGLEAALAEARSDTSERDRLQAELTRLQDRLEQMREKRLAEREAHGLLQDAHRALLDRMAQEKTA